MGNISCNYCKGFYNGSMGVRSRVGNLYPSCGYCKGFDKGFYIGSMGVSSRIGK